MKAKFWQYLTAFVVLILILNPEMADLAVFINALGLDIVLLLLEVQFVALIAVLLNTLTPLMTRLKAHYPFLLSWQAVKAMTHRLPFSVSIEATLMQLLVMTAIISVACHACLS